MAFLGTALAGLCAFLAVSCLMLCTLVAAGLADVSAKLANLLRELATTRHVGCCHAADFGAIHVECDAPGHCLDVLLLQAGDSAMVTSSSAAVAGIDASLEFFVRHLVLLHGVENILTTCFLLLRTGGVANGW